MIAGVAAFQGKDIHRQVIAIQEQDPAPKRSSFGPLNLIRITQQATTGIRVISAAPGGWMKRFVRSNGPKKSIHCRSLLSIT
jgi:hypothetical protein